MLYEFLGSRLEISPKYADAGARHAAARAAADALVADGFLLPDDVELTIAPDVSA